MTNNIALTTNMINTLTRKKKSPLWRFKLLGVAFYFVNEVDNFEHFNRQRT